MAVADASTILVYKDLGLVAQVFDEATLGSLRGHLAVGHTRYSTTGSCTWENAQPTFHARRSGGGAGTGPQRQPDQHLGACALQPDVRSPRAFGGRHK